MGILGSILGKREAGHAYRTIDGGHPAPYPDMTDQQLYNYEMTFEVPHKTFDRPPPPSPSSAPPEERMRTQGGKEEPYLQHEAGPPPTEQQQTARIYGGNAAQSAPRAPLPVQPSRPPAPPLDLSRPVRLITTKQPVEIITTRARHPVYKVQGYIGDDDVVTVFTLDGRLSENGLPYLENVPHMDLLYLNIYPNRDGLSTDRYVVTQHATQEAADADALASAGKGRGERLACVTVELNG